ncbi:MAG: AMP-binding protein [Deltaproteobacteria bacterium]|nr:AMP-binding protein [Deltaproteobacteria bacterium]
MYEQKPWLNFYGRVPPHLDYPQQTLYQAVHQSASRHPDAIAYDFMGRNVSYRRLCEEIDRCASALASLGLKRGDFITIAMPTCPQGVICFYAANKLGAVAAMVHPLATEKEIAFYLDETGSRYALTLDACYGKFKAAAGRSALSTLILARIPDCLSLPLRLGFWLTRGRHLEKVPRDPMVRWWRELMARRTTAVARAETGTHDPAVVLFSGGTTGVPKGILLSNQNFIAEGMQVAAWGEITARDSILAILPIFHGFGLGVCINAAFMSGGKSILVPQFTAETVARLIKTKRPSLLVGVPTLFDALSRNHEFQRSDLSCLRATFSGADTLPQPIKKRFEQVVQVGGGRVQLLEGYGLTEAVTAIMATPLGRYRERSIGVPFPDMLAKVVVPGTLDEASVGSDGELCLSGPAVMLGYLHHPDETAAALRTHADGRVWLHTGDIASMDGDGFFYFKLRQKRMIKSSGMNVYPAQVEECLYRHPAVLEACVVGVPDPAQGQRVKGFVVVKPPAAASPELAQELIAHCQKELIKWSCPRDIEFRSALPKTMIGKVAFKQLEDEEAARSGGAGQRPG